MKRVVMTLFLLALTLAVAFELHAARPGGGRAGGGRPSAGSRPSSAGARPIGRNNFEPGNLGGNADQAIRAGQPGAERTPGNAFRGNNVQGNAVGGDALKGAVQDHLGILPEPRQSAAATNATNRAGNVRSNYSAANQPFSPGWYGTHPNAWQYTHPHADAWGVATLAGTAAWLGWGTVPAYTYDSYYSDTENETVAQEAEALASNGSQDVAADGEWMNLGTFALAPQGQEDATLLLSLAVNKDGILRGTYFDLLSNNAQTIQGAIDKTTQLAAWRVAPDGKVTFQTSLTDLTSSLASVSLQFENGKAALWSMERQTQ